MPLAAVQLALCVFSTERLDKGSDDHRVHAGACTFYRLESRTTHVCTHSCLLSHTLEDRAGGVGGGPRHMRYSSNVQSMCAYDLVQSQHLGRS